MAFTSYRRATTDTDEPGANVAATISRFKASGHDRCRRRLLVSITEFVDTSSHHAAFGDRSVVHPLALRKGGPRRRETDKKTAKRFFKRALGREYTRNPREVVTDRLKSYPGALREMKQKGELWRFARHRRGRWLNNRVEQDHRRIKRLTRPMLGFQRFWTAKRTLAGIEAMAMLTKGQVRAVPRGDMPAQRTFVADLFGLAA